MADNKLLGTGGLYYGSNEISKAYMGSNLVWEKDSGIYMVRACNKSGASSSGNGPLYDGIPYATYNWKIQIGLKNYFTRVSNSYGYYTTVGCPVTMYNNNPFIQLGDYGFYYYNYGVTKSNFGETTGVYLEFEYTPTSVKCFTYNKTYTTSRQSTQGIYLVPSRSSYNGYCDCSFHYMKMWNGTTLLHDVIAKKIDGNPGFYDNVDGSFFKESDANNSNFKLYDDYLQV